MLLCRSVFTLTRLDARAICWNSPGSSLSQSLVVSDDVAASLSCLGERGCARRLFSPPAVAACAWIRSPRRTCQLLEQSWLVAVAGACLLVMTSPHPSPASESVAVRVVSFRRPQLQRARRFDLPRLASHLLEQSWLIAVAGACLLVFDFAALLSCLGECGWARGLFPPSAVTTCALI